MPEGVDRLYAIPRMRKCISRLMIEILNEFGNLGGYDVLLQFLADPENNEIDLNTLSYVVNYLSVPYPLYHKSFI